MTRPKITEFIFHGYEGFIRDFGIRSYMHIDRQIREVSVEIYVHPITDRKIHRHTMLIKWIKLYKFLWEFRRNKNKFPSIIHRTLERMI